MPDINQVAVPVDTEESLLEEVASLQARVALAKEVYKKLAEVTAQLEAEFEAVCLKLIQFLEEQSNHGDQ